MTIMDRRLDYFAQAAMHALMTREKADFQLTKNKQGGNGKRNKVIARQAYKLAQAMEAEAVLNP